MEEYISRLLTSVFSESFAQKALIPASILIIAILAAAVYIICCRILKPITHRITRRTATDWDDDLLNDNVLKAGCQLAPALLVSVLLPASFSSYPQLHSWLIKGTNLYILFAVIHLINTFIQSLFDALDKRNPDKIHTLRGVMQMLKLFFIIIGIICAISILIGKSPLTIIAALGASAAILMLVFQDTILGVVAGIQLSANNMLKKGDWIIVPGTDANGEVLDISLTTIKVRNWDNTVVTVPPYSLIKNSFQNYQPMQESGGRRVRRSIYIDFNSIRFLSGDEISGLINNGLINQTDSKSATDTVNLQLFSTHIESYLSQHNEVNKSMLIMVRQLQPTPQGLPVELYFFTNDTSWKNYEQIQSSVFNYIFATIHHFHLSIYQAPAGSDIKQLEPRSV